MDHNIPQDVLEIILSYISEDMGTLKQCALVSSPWLISTRKRLFSTISLQDSRRCWQLYQLLNVNAEIGGCIRNLHLDGNQRPLDPRRSQSWIADPTLPHILAFLPRLQSLELCHVYWGELSPRLRDELLRLLQTPDMISVQLMSVHSFPTGLVHQLAQLKRLSLLSLSGPDGQMESSAILPDMSSTRGRQLHALEFDQRANSIKSVKELHWSQQHSRDLSQLRELSITGPGTGAFAEVVSEILTASSHSLEFLAWKFQRRHQIVAKPPEDGMRELSLASTSNLRFLLIETSLNEGLRYVLPWVIRALRYPSPAATLEQLVIILKGGQWDQATYFRTICDDRLWRELDIAVKGTRRAQLRLILADTPKVVRHRARWAEAEMMVLGCMPLLHNAGALAIQLGIDSDKFSDIREELRSFIM